MRQLLAAGLAAGLLAVSPAAFGQAAFDGHVKVGVLNDQSSLYADATGQGSVIAARMALEDYMKANPNSKLKVEIIFADHQNKPDIGANIAREWIERDGVDMILDVPNSAVALAVNEVTRQLNKVMVNGSAGTVRLTGDACSPNTVHWTFDNFALANGTGRAVVATGGDSWFFITADYAFGHDLEAQTAAVVKAMGGQVLGAVRVPLNTSDFSSYLLQAQNSKAKVIGLANAGGDTINSIKQAAEFGIVKAGQRIAGLLVFITDVNSLGLEAAQGLQFTEAFYWDMNDDTRAWTRRFVEMMNGRLYPTMNHAGNYGGMLHYLKAVEAAQTTDGAKVVAKMKELPTSDATFGAGRVREDGRHLHPMYLWQAKRPDESRAKWDYYTLVKAIPAADAWRPLDQGGCSLVAKKS
ncbi:MAG TPA: ABC transporter substrate-binding protein [Xanthobacteraceae bacterium]|nr:ABC transporter substrate-binding protein [Xanthobacteraceae bacterium]